MKKQCGFSLIELMIALAIVAILAGLAWPSYQEQVRTSRRADAQGALMGLAQAMERHLTSSGTYEGAAVLDGNAANLGAPRIFPDKIPISGTAPYSWTPWAINSGIAITRMALNFRKCVGIEAVIDG